MLRTLHIPSPGALEHLPAHSETPSDQHGTFPVLLPLFSGNSDSSEIGLRFHRALKCVTLRSENTPFMTEMRLRSMIISGTWMPIMTPVHSGYQHRLDLTLYSIPFVSDTGLFRDSINDILCLVQPRSELNPYSLVPVIFIPVT